MFHAIHLGALMLLIWMLYPIALFVLWIYLMYTAYVGRKVILPVVGPMAEKQAYSA